MTTHLFVFRSYLHTVTVLVLKPNFHHFLFNVLLVSTETWCMIGYSQLPVNQRYAKGFSVYTPHISDNYVSNVLVKQ